MKQISLLLILFPPLLLHAQQPINPIKALKPDSSDNFLFIDTFDNGLSLWNGEVSKFVIENQSLSNQEGMKSPSFLHTPNTEVRNKVWEVGLEINGLLTTQNNVRIYMAATNDSLPGNQQGYYLQLDGASGMHSYKLYKQNNTSRITLFQSKSRPTRENKLRARVRVTCNTDGEWKVFTDEYDQGEFEILTDPKGNSSVVDLSHQTSLFSGWMTRFSSTRIKDYKLHYFLIKDLEDIPPAIDENTYKAKPYDVIINEIMADPSSPMGLPEAEYVELKNLSNEVIYLNGWTYSSLTRTYHFQKDSILPQAFLILYRAADSLLMKDFDNSIALVSWPILVNTGTSLTLRNEDGLLIDKVDYQTPWYRDPKKSKGGWSLERIDPYLRCNDDNNWIASVDSSGGTPGRENSVHDSNSDPFMEIIDISFISSNELKVSFNKEFDPLAASSKTIYRINNGMGIPDSVKITDSKSLILFYFNDFIKGQHYRLNIEKMEDCVANTINLTGEIFLPDRISPKDILINEVLADPFKNGVEFVEIYNNSDKTLDLNTLSIGTISESSGAVHLKRISSESHFLPPSTYRLLSADSKSVASQYINSAQESFIQMASFPQLKNSNGIIVLMDDETQIDRFDYNENMHSELITNKKGVSLERVNFATPTNTPGNFKSAAATVGYATPGYKNSQFNETKDPSVIKISLTSKTFSPDNDGFEDLLEINYSSQTEDLMITIEIYNDKGLLIRTLNKNHRLANQGTIYWDGLMDNGQLAKVGIYIIFLELYNAAGVRKIVKKSCILASKF